MSDLLVVDASAWHRVAHSTVADAWDRELDEDRVAVTPPAVLEILFSARSAEEYEEFSEELSSLRQVACGAAACRRALDVQHALARQHAMHHRSVGVVDLLIAAAAELAGATVWHYDSDYDRIAEVTGQAAEWIVPKGSV